jgi:Transposase
LTVNLSVSSVVGQLLGGGTPVEVWRIALQEQDDPPCRTKAAVPSRTQSRKEGMTVTMVDTWRPVTGGVDTHLDVNVAAVLDGIGGLLGVESFATSVEGNQQLLAWMAGFGPVARVGVEGTGSYGASLARFLREAGVEALEVDRPNRQERRRKGKTDVVDAIEAARAAQGQRQLGAAKTKDGNVEAIRALMVAKRSARDHKIAAMNQIRHLGFTAPEEIRQSLQGVSRRLIAKKAAAMRPRGRFRSCGLCHQDGAAGARPAGARARRGT